MILPVPPIPPVGKILSRPYEGEIGNFQEKKASINRISTLIHEVNPDYLLFHSSISSIQNVTHAVKSVEPNLGDFNYAA